MDANQISQNGALPYYWLTNRPTITASSGCIIATPSSAVVIIFICIRHHMFVRVVSKQLDAFLRLLMKCPVR